MAIALFRNNTKTNTPPRRQTQMAYILSINIMTPVIGTTESAAMISSCPLPAMPACKNFASITEEMRLALRQMPLALAFVNFLSHTQVLIGLVRTGG